MIGTRQWMCKTQKCISQEDLNNGNLTSKYFDKLLTQGKKLSQIITYIWLNKDYQTAQKLDGYFKRGNDEELKKLFSAKDPQTEEYKLLLKVFGKETYLPIYNQDDLKYLKFRVIVDKFEGDIDDPGPSDNGVLTVTIPYPPRPEISDNSESQKKVAPIKKSELEEWLKHPSDRQPYFYENNPYIPSTSS